MKLLLFLFMFIFALLVSAVSESATVFLTGTVEASTNGALCFQFYLLSLRMFPGNTLMCK